MDSDHRSKAYPSSESVGGFYEQMGPFFASLFGEDIHFGIWEQDDTSSMTAAQSRLTDRLISLLRLKDEDYLLDVGCGTGHPAMRLAEQTRARILGVNVSPSQVDTAAAKSRAAGLSSRLEFVHADAMELPYESGTFDAAWAVEMLFHVPDRLQVLREIHRTLKPGGRVVLTDFVEREQLTGHEWDLLTQGFAFSSLLRPQDYGDVVARAGFEAVHVHDVTAETRKNMEWIQSRYEDAKELLASHYGPDYTAQMDQLLPTGLSIYTEKLGYVIVEAHRPTL
ncbi:ubiquinone/menaquinone biosynthesis C-methylase UbiE [Kitasatospora sp. MAP12-15]|uniref:SAM-dependent methyltransferase n=1 Tax=unclassified Kitasatospora TaxID=2633591 RepID=UPI002477111C|nr:class I SAM-dependent methyltransferase [Kitasatospora sp. MAP12-44]MDH6110114.1 ubiquinone/menaquinone biosynthesis C-methylase UbiE [Kitasatospora sp. MAP12-44]